MLRLLLSMLLSLLPKRYRDRLPEVEGVDLRQGTLFSGLFQLLACLLIFVVRYPDFLRHRVQRLGEAVIARGAEEALASEAVQFGMGYVTMIEYVLHPLSMLLVYFAIEGAVRAYAAAITEEIVGTLPLHMVAWGEERLRQACAERALGPRVLDLVEHMPSVAYQLRIASCRPKPTWDRLMTVAYEGQFYHVLAEQQGSPPHRFIYQLRTVPPGWTIRGIHHYDPTEVLPKKEGSTTVALQFWAWFHARVEWRRAGRAPWIPDLVERIDGRDYQLRICSCRPKPTWNHLMTVEYEGEFHEVVAEKRGSPPHAYVYLLRKLPPGKVIRGLHHYHPDEPPDKQ